MFKIILISLFSFLIGFFSRNIIKSIKKKFIKKDNKYKKSIPLSERNFGEAMDELKIK